MPTSNWILHVKEYQKNHPTVSYKNAMSLSKNTYQKQNDVKKKADHKTPKTNVTLKEAKDFIKRNNLNYADILKDSKKYQM